ncbi:MAG TPA: haloalkane dehalogenase [Xanthobacteraceae bacterium]|nr:haloalkane dehalogenase [Xanthobacteraceae bacterium]
MPILRTPEARFENLPGFPYAPHYLDALPGYPGMRMHYVDEGPRQAGHVFLCLHGEPSWAYLYRKMIPVFVAAGGRAVAPDFFGFGRSDKPAEDAAYTFDFHRRSLIAFIEALDLQRITLVCQDWGGLIGLTLPMDMPGRFLRLVVMNTFLPTGEEPLGKGFLAWRAFANAHPDMEVGRLIQRGTPHLSAAEVAAYDAPYPDASFKAGVRRFPNLVPDRPDAPGAELSRRARAWWTNDWRSQSFMAIGAADPVLGEPAMLQLKTIIRGCPAPMVLKEAGHFVQEWGERIANAALASFA